jgi:hypothetical protein
MPESKNDIFFEEFFKTSDTLKVLDSLEESIFVISIDEFPTYFVQNLKKARQKMIDLAGFININYFNTYNCFLQQINENEIKLIGTNKFVIISYDKILATLRINEINKYSYFELNNLVQI